jgi:hypothetical protein
MLGTIITYDAIDCLGWVELEDGTMVRFALEACFDLRPKAGVGVIVEAVSPGHGGDPQATRLEPLLATLEPTRSSTAAYHLLLRTLRDETLGA